jgi:photosystem II stability/assembly factor-like uncharacterized protein
MKRFVSMVALLVASTSFAAAQGKQPGKAAKKTTAGAQETSRPKFKAIWEPVSYKEDIRLLDAYFVSEEEGWVSGDAGTILHTKNGGNSWTAELGGDPHAQGEQLIRVFFSDATHGWAQSSGSMFRTTDGETWQQVGGDVRGYAVFLSREKGFRIYGGRMFSTNDGGKSWKEMFICHAKMEVQGLTQERGCDFLALHFPSPTVGYALGSPRIMYKTVDGGATWNVSVGPEEPGDQRVYDVFFVDENTGYHVRSGGKLFKTTDGGQTWQGLIATLNPTGITKVKFVDREVGWSFAGVNWAYTVDAGKHWTSRQFRFPADVMSFSLPTRSRAYVVGDHGMIYRYRVVPIDYTAKGMIEAPMMPAKQ